MSDVVTGTSTQAGAAATDDADAFDTPRGRRYAGLGNGGDGGEDAPRRLSLLSSCVIVAATAAGLWAAIIGGGEMVLRALLG